MKFTKRITLIIALLLLMPSFTFASGEAHNVFHYIEPDITIEFAEDNTFDQNTKQRIADQYAGLTPSDHIGGESTDNILCVLLGHDTSESVVAVIYHKVYEHDPRCRKDFYIVTACSRCDYTVDEFAGSIDIHCHPEDSVM